MSGRGYTLGTRNAILAAFVTSGMVSVLWVARMPAIRDALGLTPSEVGLALLASAVGSIASIPVVSRLSVRFGSDAVLSLSLPVMAVGALALGAASSYALLVAAAVLAGACLGATDVAMNSQASVEERRSGEPVMARMHAGWSFGSALGAGIAALTAALGAPVIVTMAIGSVLLVGAWAPARSSYIPDAADSGQAEGGRTRIRLPRIVLLIGVLMALAYLIEGAVIGWSTLYLHDVFGVAAWLAAAGYLAYEIAMVLGRLAGDWIRARWGDRRSALVGSGAATAGLALVAVAPTAPVAVLGLAVVGFGQSAVVPIAFAAAGVAGGRLASAAIARVGGFGYAGMLAGPAAFGVVAQAASIRAGFFGLLVLAAATIGVIASGAVVASSTGAR